MSILRINVDIDHAKVTKWGRLYFGVKLLTEDEYGIVGDVAEAMLPGFEWDEPKAAEGPVFSFSAMVINESRAADKITEEYEAT